MQSKFKCECCGSHRNADVKGAKSIEARRSMPEITTFTPKRAILKTLVAKFVASLERFRVVNNNSNTVFYSCPYNLSVIKDNPYFEDYLLNREFNLSHGKVSLVDKIP